MRKLALMFLLAVPLCAQVADRAYIKTLYAATALLYAQGEDGGMKMRCTATAIGKDEKGYLFVSAAHCGCEDNVDKKQVTPEKAYFFITADEEVSKDFMRASLVGCGYRHRGDDFALFHVDTKLSFPVIPLGTDPELVSSVINVGSPLGLGKQVFFGSVSSSVLNRPVISDDINWDHVVLLQIFGINGGSSGSSLVCVEQKAICGFVVGSIRDTTMVAMPVERFKKFKEQWESGNYKWWNPDPDSDPKPAKAEKK
jgi:hypothetical protein